MDIRSSVYMHIYSIYAHMNMYMYILQVCVSAVMLHVCSCLQGFQSTLSNVEYTAVCENCDWFVYIDRKEGACQQLYPALVLRVQFSQQIILFHI